MLSFGQLIEAADSKQNLHLTHADEDIYERGVKGAHFAIQQIRAAAAVLGSDVKTPKNLTSKWDGAPAIFAGYDPADGVFFCGTKAVFTKNPKLNKTHEDINNNHQGDLATKLHIALDLLPKIGIPKDTVLQGDMMFTREDLKHETIDGQRYITFHPNTIVYAVPKDTELGRTISRAKMGVVWHTTYKGSSTLDTYAASFGADVTKLREIGDIWQDDAYFKDLSGAATFTAPETKRLESYISAAEKSIGRFDNIVRVMGMLPSGAIGAHIKTFINSNIRAGRLPNPRTATREYTQYIKDYWARQVIGKVKTDKAKATKKAALDQFLREIKKVERDIATSFAYVDHINKAKILVIQKLNTLNRMKTFVKKKNGDWEVTNQEGFVAIDHVAGAAIKLVDRLEFSKNNFSPDVVKGWEK